MGSFVSAQLAIYIRKSKCNLSVCLSVRQYVNQGDTNRSCCTQRLIILRAQIYQ